MERKTTTTARFLLGTLYVSITAAIIAAVMLSVPFAETKQVKAYLGGTTLSVSVADTVELQTKGLSGRSHLLHDEGMLFVFPGEGQYSFWMKDMRFPLDIVWFDKNYRVVEVHERVSPDTYPQVFTSQIPAQYVLEVPAGYFAKHHLRIGNILQILN